mmetsp:Transcript_31054/g.85032  ORF Transcript_31054/g.85032 Transcript_31054/m.85032 type:complete len:216 (+) Transcript_31054:3-650(+)
MESLFGIARPTSILAFSAVEGDAVGSGGFPVAAESEFVAAGGCRSSAAAGEAPRVYDGCRSRTPMCWWLVCQASPTTAESGRRGGRNSPALSGRVVRLSLKADCERGAGRVSAVWAVASSGLPIVAKGAARPTATPWFSAIADKGNRSSNRWPNSAGAARHCRLGPGPVGSASAWRTTRSAESRWSPAGFLHSWQSASCRVMFSAHCWHPPSRGA